MSGIAALLTPHATENFMFYFILHCKDKCDGFIKDVRDFSETFAECLNARRQAKHVEFITAQKKFKFPISFKDTFT